MLLDLPAPDADTSAHSDRLRQAIAAEIRSCGGCIPFSRYMELALYAPGLGYYSAGATKFGEAGDFVTSPELGPLFARSVANAFARTLAALGGEAHIVELGGGSGAFARDVLLALQGLGVLPARYLILEPSADLRQRQQERLSAQLPADLLSRVEWLTSLPEKPWRGVLFANEVLDALPTTRFAVGQEELQEEHVGLDVDGALVRIDRPADALLLRAVNHIERALGRRLPVGYRSEVLVQLPWWLQAVTQAMQQGLVLFLDYGYPRSEFYLPERVDGTLICHYRHRAHAEPLWLPGLSDITAFVDFSAVAEAGEAAGFELAGFAPQAGFLLGCGLLQQLESSQVDAAHDASAGARMTEQARRLLLPGEMGERFKAMGLQRGIDVSGLFAEADRRGRL
ncbi:MAG: class I SAM-dependent methyltransferase [Pseudomarimonas sp.]